MNLSVCEKRTFIHLAFSPNGAQVCAALGLATASEDVDAAEDKAAVKELQEFMDSDRFGDVVKLAGWYSEACVVLDNVHIERSDVDHMLSFFAAAAKLTHS